MNNKEIAKQLGRAGGNKVLKKYGKKHFKEMINKRWEKEKSKTEKSLI